MRPPITSVGPLVEMIRDQMHLSNTMAWMIPTIPLVMFPIFSPFILEFVKRFGIEGVLFIAVILLTLGSFMRAIFGTSMIILYARITIIGIGIAACNVSMQVL